MSNFHILILNYFQNVESYKIKCIKLLLGQKIEISFSELTIFQIEQLIHFNDNQYCKQ